MQTTTAERHESNDLEERDVRALTEYMAVLPEGGDIYTVVGQNENGEYRVDAREGRCTCPDAEYNLEDGERCKHELRTLAATGRRSVPAWIDRDAIDGLLGAHTEGSPRLVATDGGEVLTADAAAEERPDACECSGHERETLPCWYCYAEGFDEPNPAPASD